jgi:hypothetical protein
VWFVTPTQNQSLKFKRSVEFMTLVRKFGARCRSECCF